MFGVPQIQKEAPPYKMGHNYSKKRENDGLELQKAGLKNTSLLAKLAWKASQDPTTIWASLLLQKYSPTEKLDEHSKVLSYHNKT